MEEVIRLVPVASPTRSESSSLHPRRRVTTRTLLLSVVALGLALRIGSALLLPTVHFPDEVFQTLEPAHRLAFGPSVTTWEFHVGLRSMVFPGVLAGIMRATAWLAPGSLGYLAAIKVFLSLLSLTVIFAAFRIAQRTFDDRVALLCAGICAFWYELVYFAPRTLSEVVATDLLLPGIYLAAFSSSDETNPSRRQLFFAGVLCATALMIRNQLAPAVVVLILYACRKDWRNRWLPTLAGVFPVVLLFGVVDWITWSYPFQPVYTIFDINLIQHKAAQFGIEPFNFYVRKWLTFLGPMLLFSVIGAVTVRRARILGYLVLAIVIPHSVLAHKEVRYVYPALPLMLILAGLGIWQCALWFRDNTRWKSVWISVAAILLIAAGTTTVLDLPKMRWHHDEGALRSMQLLSHTPDACGVALYGLDWSDSGGYAYLHRDIPLFQTTLEYPYKPISPEAEKNIQHWMNFNQMAPAFNYVIASQSLTYGDYRAVQCWNGTCLYKRPGNCAKIPDYSTSELLHSMDR